MNALTVSFYITLCVAIMFTLYFVYAKLLTDKRVYDFQNELLKLKRSNKISSALYFTIISKLYGFNVNITDKEYFTERPIMSYLLNADISVKIIKEKLDKDLFADDDGLAGLIRLLNFHIPDCNIGYSNWKEKYIKSIFNREIRKYRDIAETTLHRVNSKTIDELIRVPRRTYQEANPRLFKEAKERFMDEYKTKYTSEAVERIKAKIPHDHYLRDNPELLIKDLSGPAESLINEYIEKNVLSSDAYLDGGVTTVLNDLNKRNVVSALTAMLLDSLGEVYIARLSYMLGLELGYVHIQNKLVLPLLEARLKIEKDLEMSRRSQENMSVYESAKSITDKYIESFKSLVSSLIISGNLEDFIQGYNELQNISGMDNSGINYNIISEKKYEIGRASCRERVYALV